MLPLSILGAWLSEFGRGLWLTFVNKNSFATTLEQYYTKNPQLMKPIQMMPQVQFPCTLDLDRDVYTKK